MKAQNNHINYIEFKAKDLKQTEVFYQNVFGWQFTSYGRNYISFAASGVEGGFEKTEDPIVNGVLELNKNPENYFADVEQSAFNPASVVPGIGFSPDKMLQVRLFSYGDAQRYRLGVNHYQIPVNKPKCPFHNSHRDGAIRVDGNEGGSLHYEPNSYGQWAESPEHKEPPMELDGAAFHYDHREDDHYYTQLAELFSIMSPAQKQTLFDNTAAQIGGAEQFIQERHLVNCYKAKPAYAEGVAKALGLDINKIDLF